MYFSKTINIAGYGNKTTKSYKDVRRYVKNVIDVDDN